MKVYEQFKDIPEATTPSVVSIGSFDGFHQGHQLLFKRIKDRAKQKRWQVGVLTFFPHPAKVLAPKYSPPLLMSQERKLRAFEALGFDFVLSQRFTKHFAALSAKDFVRQVLKSLSAKEVVVGDDFSFGRSREGLAEDLKILGHKQGLEVEVIRRLVVEGMVVSSTRIRAFLLQGKVRGAAVLLGRPYVIAGRVVSGAGRGRKLGYPTVNLQSDAEILPARGVYACYLWHEEQSQGLFGVANVGIWLKGARC